MENFLDKIFNSELVQWFRDLFSSLTEKIESISILNRTPSKKFLAVGFSVIICVLTVVSAAFIITDNKKENDEATTESTGAVNEKVLAAQSTKDIDATFLLALTDNDGGTVHSIIVAKFSSAAEKLTLSFVDPSASVTVNDSTGNMQQHLERGGISEFLWAISEHTGLGFNRYLICDESAFLSLMEMLGETTVEIEKQISFDHDGIKFIIDKGTQSLTADMMLKYYLYLTYFHDEYANEIAFVLTDIIERLLTAENDEALEKRFCSALGLFTTDISAIDFSDHKDAVRSIPEMNLFEKTVIE